MRALAAVRSGGARLAIGETVILLAPPVYSY